MKGKLYLIPAFLAETEFGDVMPEAVKLRLEEIVHYFVEDEKTCRRYIKKVVPSKVIDSIRFFPIGKHADTSEAKTFLRQTEAGVNIGLLSEAGAPAVADPGSGIVALAHEMGIKVVPMAGPSSILMALMASGLGGQNFAFSGYLPIDRQERRQALRKLEQRVQKDGQSQIFIETPFRNNSLFSDIIQGLQNDTRLCLASDLTAQNEEIACKSIAEWKKQAAPELNKRPTVFIIGK